MIRAAVLGSPISHSLSPALHKRAYDLLGVPASYGAIELTPEHAGDFFQRALQEEWTGFSLTMPLKETIFDLDFHGVPSEKNHGSIARYPARVLPSRG